MILQGASDRDVSAGLARRRLRGALLASAAAHVIVLFPASLPRPPLAIAQPLSVTLREWPAAVASVDREAVKLRKAPVPAGARDAAVRKRVPRDPIRKPILAAMAPAPIARVPNELPKPSAIDAARAGAESSSAPAGDAGAASRTASGPAGGPDAAEGVDPGALRDYRFAVARVVRKRYPPLAIERGWTGTAHVRLTLSPNGLPSDVTVVASSGHAVLDAQAQTSIAMAARLAVLPAALLGRGFHVDLPVEFRLEDLLSQR